MKEEAKLGERWQRGGVGERERKRKTCTERGKEEGRGGRVLEGG